MFPTFQESIDRLAHVAAPPAPLPSKRAAVVIGLRDGSAGPEILMINARFEKVTLGLVIWDSLGAQR